MDTESKTNSYLSISGKNVSVLDEAWDLFIDYLAEKSLKTPITHQEFENLFSIVFQDSKFFKIKSKILYSFQHDSYAWPIVEKERR